MAIVILVEVFEQVLLELIIRKGEISVLEALGNIDRVGTETSSVDHPAGDPVVGVRVGFRHHLHVEIPEARGDGRLTPRIHRRDCPRVIGSDGQCVGSPIRGK